MIRMLLALTLFSSASTAAVTVIDFQDNPTVDSRSNFTYGGLRFSPKCHVSIAGHDQIWLSSEHDNGNCHSRGGEFEPFIPPNPDFLGRGWENLFVDREGEAFTLLSIAGVGPYGTAFTVVSSKGGTLRGEVPGSCCDLPYQTFVLEGPLWTDIVWFQLFNHGEGFGWQSHQGWDDIKWSRSVPEPATLILFLVVLPFALWMRSRGYR